MLKTMITDLISIQIATYVATTNSLLIIMNTLGFNCGTNSHRYADKTDTARLNVALEKVAQIDILEASTTIEEILYGPDESPRTCDGHRKELLLELDQHKLT
ncbi:uncharacterized protein LOC130452796 [Diorhabda sublineata]|uniref:uncharacterized protein LOC130452796 n=1 Tax=Diorhabda sublineata TaxID=1163346 RepID=UPI0024E18253|nr:uncharacterized protein LOC130452796 [Diorhabda sublineata]